MEVVKEKLVKVTQFLHAEARRLESERAPILTPDHTLMIKIEEMQKIMKNIQIQSYTAVYQEDQKII